MSVSCHPLLCGCYPGCQLDLCICQSMLCGCQLVLGICHTVLCGCHPDLCICYPVLCGCHPVLSECHPIVVEVTLCCTDVIRCSNFTKMSPSFEWFVSISPR